MTALVKKYAKKPQEEWPPLFYRILSNKIRDCQRRNSLRQRFAAFLPESEDGDTQLEELVVDEQTPERTVEVQQQLQQVAEAMKSLPKRQHQVFVMRTLEGLSVQQCATALGISEGSIKTHLSRAMQTIRQTLGVQGIGGLEQEVGET